MLIVFWENNSGRQQSLGVAPVLSTAISMRKSWEVDGCRTFPPPSPASDTGIAHLLQWGWDHAAAIPLPSGQASLLDLPQLCSPHLRDSSSQSLIFDSLTSTRMEEISDPAIGDVNHPSNQLQDKRDPNSEEDCDEENPGTKTEQRVKKKNYQRYPKPPYTYLALITIAILNSPEKRLKLSQVKLLSTTMF